ncbi:MAG: alpha/beta fold hydrolase [Planctomycetota bacterium]
MPKTITTTALLVLLPSAVLAESWCERAWERTKDTFSTAQIHLEQALDQGLIHAESAFEQTVARAQSTVENAKAEATQRQSENLGIRYYDGTQAEWVTDIPENTDRAVILIHGLDEVGNIWNEISPQLDSQGHTTLRFNYPNDQHPAEAASTLLDELTDLHAEGIREVALVGHSMGGLVARDAATRPTDQALPEFTHVITVGTPAGGANLAHAAVLSDVKEHAFRIATNGRLPDLADVLAYQVDGCNESGEALLPGSDYLAALGTREFHENTRSTAIIGQWAKPIADTTQSLENTKIADWIGEHRVHAFADNVESLTQRFGDAIVSVNSAESFEPEDTVIVTAHHRSLLANFEPLTKAREMVGLQTEEPPAIAIILDRLADERSADE